MNQREKDRERESERSKVACIRGQHGIVSIYALAILVGACLNTHRVHILSVCVTFLRPPVYFFMILFALTTNFIQQIPVHLLSAFSYFYFV